MAIPTIAQVTKVSIEGDSITSQCTTGTTIYNAIGWVNSLNALSGNRFPYAISQNFAVGGGTIVDMDSTKVTQLGAATGEMIFLLAGTNDWAASTSLATIQAALTSIKNYVLNTLQKRLCVVGLMPRTQTGGTPMGSTLIATARSYNAWLVAQRDVANGFHVVDPYDALCTVGTDEPNPTYFKNESSKLLHPNTAGSLVLGQTVWTQLKIDGFSGTDAPPVGSPNMFAYGSMSGSGGTATSPAVGTVSTGITVTGSGGSQARTCTVSSEGLRVQFAPSSGDGAAVNFKVTASTNVTSARGYSVGDTVRGWALISTGTLNLCDGPWLQLSDVGSTTTTYYGYNHGGNTTGYFPSDQKFILMTTPSFAVASGNTGLKPEIVCQLNATGAGAVADVTVHSMGIINETTTRAISTLDLRGILLPNVDPTPPVAIFDGDYPLGDWVAPTGLVGIFDFEHGDVITENKGGFTWRDGSAAYAIPPAETRQGMTYFAAGSLDPTVDSNNDKYFDFTQQNEICMIDEMYIPTNYYHRSCVALTMTGDITGWLKGHSVTGLLGATGTVYYVSGQTLWLNFATNRNDNNYWVGSITNTTISSTRTCTARTIEQSNNKRFVIYCDAYSFSGKSPTIIWEMEADNLGGSLIYHHYAIDGNVANFDSSQVPYIDYSTDRGTYIKTAFYAKMSTSEGATDGIIALYKQAEGGAWSKLIEVTNADIGPRAAATPTNCKFKSGYQNGYANSGYEQDTTLYVTSVSLYSSKPAFLP